MTLLRRCLVPFSPFSLCENKSGRLYNTQNMIFSVTYYLELHIPTSF